MNKLVTIFLLVGWLNSAQAQWGASPVESPVNVIQDAVLQGRYESALQLIKQGLQTRALSSVESAKIMSIYSNLLGLKKFRDVDSGWVLPKGITDIRIRVVRIEEKGRANYKLSLGGTLDKIDRVNELVVTKYPNIVVLDKNKKIGKFESEPDEGAFSFSCDTMRSQLPVPPGYYHVSLSNDSGERGEGWFILDNQMNSSAGPAFTNLQDGQVLNGLPNLQWNEFRSPEYKPTEATSPHLNIGKLDSDSNWTSALGYWDDDTMTSVRVGTTPASEKKVDLPLKDGNYMVILGYGERRSIGNVRLVRKSVTRVKFSVVNK